MSAPSPSRCSRRCGSASSWCRGGWSRSEEHTSELQSLMRISYAVFCLQKKKIQQIHYHLIILTYKVRIANMFFTHQAITYTPHQPLYRAHNSKYKLDS